MLTMSVAAAQGTSQIRVVLVTHYFPDHSGGVERIAGELAARLAKIVLHVLLLMTDALSRHPHLVTCTVVVQTKKIQKMNK